MVVAPDQEGKASGILYLDNGKSFDYQTGPKLYMQFTWDSGRMQREDQVCLNYIRTFDTLSILQAWLPLSG